MEPRNIKLNRWEWGQEEHQTGQKTRDGKVECIRPEKQEDKLMHRSGEKEAPKEEKIQPLCWTKGPLLESRKETALSSPRNDALSAAIPACWRGCGNGRGARRRRGRGAAVVAVAEAEAEAMVATGWTERDCAWRVL